MDIALCEETADWGGGGVDALAWQQASQASMYCLKYVRGLFVTYCTLLMDFRWMTNEMTDWRLTKMKAILYMNIFLQLFKYFGGNIYQKQNVYPTPPHFTHKNLFNAIQYPVQVPVPRTI